MINILCIIGIFTATFFGGLSLILVSLLKNEKDRCKKLKRENRELEKLSITDPLTGAFTRRLLETIFPSELSRAKRTGMPLVPLMVDIDRFKTINDTYGHQAGDKVLRELVKRIKSILREPDKICRYGGEEFLIILPDCLSGKIVAERIRQKIEKEYFDIGKEKIPVTISVGYTTFNTREDKRNIEEIIEDADNALYKAKHTGRNKVVCLD
ncbi:hypothetical protein A2331_05060 [Candidatus Falkowbacteria bacterium RIFOXYB2_FULL_34_18]|uniref:GGDEF domain-containing protein n=1 Tax=Candidatus Falkowbacteria bacterium RIFOXYD2_FULL_34_120 TaxID=1798007 RepID=A0A1F5TP79_9BACT|nr:MAG: hypothetical protein A2500_07185 [Candidatus Falkowbacteria bacterium RIFOXYC12_FULL_34_55]OGF28715.1 MAG: hypothetical protein A2331_05060 [Candidatus Falkowbacteria bacterium RIFOXYB2_FULL_34_18]OGF38080.1 MAG: hypothetical protein A2466_04240 [Candidatus Falkowbacteria bacterium RIFOXYC2_FULL_34_220]OGF38334.1 MAG: hypothetical protein A2515_06270 [Candidatus Falkowbacteria bacterium RIFOXYD12_FULL_34_57]OGF40321.1 MAG: hypothetical protein A2531_00530 [Candidatus Falkowbacteria bact